MRARHVKKRAKTPLGIKMTVFLAVIIVAFTVIQGISWLSAKEDYTAKEKELNQKIEKEKYRTQKLLDYQEYMKTDEYIEDIAGSDLGMVYDGDILFKEID